jgi:competence protein ComEC
VAPGEIWESGGVRVEVLASAPGPTTENARGLALCIDVGSLRLFVPGDRPAASLDAAAARCAGASVAWVSHHGAADGTTRELLGVLGARVAVVSAGFDNPYCHPAPETLARLDGLEIWITGAAGLGPAGPCRGLAAMARDDVHVVGEDLWIAAASRARALPGGLLHCDPSCRSTFEPWASRVRSAP